MLASVLSSNVANARREIEYTTLWDRSVHKPGNVLVLVADGAQAAGHAKPVEEARDCLEEVRADLAVGDGRHGRVGWRCVMEDGQCLAMPVGRGGRGELEDGGGAEGNTEDTRVRRSIRSLE